MKLVTFLLVALALAPAALAQQEMEWISTDGSALFDSAGRNVILRGFVTVTHFDFGKDEVTLTQPDYERMRMMGANYQSIRIFAGWIGAWPSYEPREGYLEKLDSMVSLAKENGIYSGFKLTLYDLPGMSNFTNTTQEEETWGNFWRNKNGEQEALISGWKRIWDNFKDEPSVFGYDILNEPEIGNLGVDPEVFTRDYLTQFYRKAIDEFRTVDNKHLILIQSGFGGVSPGTGDIVYYPYNMPIGKPEIVYAPHFYTNFVKHEDGIYFPERYQPLLDGYLAEAKTHNAPLFLGEMGEFFAKENDGDAAKEAAFRMAEDQQIDLFDKEMLGFSRAVYANDRSIAKGHNILKGTSKNLAGSEERSIITDAFSRPYPQKTAGSLTHFIFDSQTKEFSMTYKPANGVTEIYIPLHSHYKIGFVVNHSTGIVLAYDPALASLVVIQGGVDANRFSWDNLKSVLKVEEWLEGETVMITVTPGSLQPTEPTPPPVPEPTPSEEEHDAEIMSTGLGAELRLLQLERAITKRVLLGSFILEAIQEKTPDADVSQLNSILDQMDALIEEVQSAQDNAQQGTISHEESVQEFVSMKDHTKSLAKDFKGIAGGLVSVSDRAKIKQSVEEKLETADVQVIKDLNNEIKNVRQELRANRVSNFFGKIGVNDPQIIEDVANGKISLRVIKQRLREHVKNMPPEERREAATKVREAKAERGVFKRSTIDKVRSERLERKSNIAGRVSNRLERGSNVLERRSGIAEKRGFEERAERLEKRSDKLERRSDKLGRRSDRLDRRSDRRNNDVGGAGGGGGGEAPPSD